MVKIDTTGIPYTNYKLKKNMIIVFGNEEEKIIT